VSFLTAELGLLSAIAKNAARSVRRFGGGLLDPGAVAFYEFRIRGDSGFCLVARGERGPGASAPPGPSPVLGSLAAWALELARVFETPRTPAPEAFAALKGHLRALALADGGPPALAARSLSLGFTGKYLGLAGFGAPLSACSVCGRPPRPPEDWAWDALEPRAVCPSCLPRLDPAAARGLAPVPARLLAALASLSPSESPSPPLPAPEAALAEAFYRALAPAVSGRPFLSAPSLEQYLAPPPAPEAAAPAGLPGAGAAGTPGDEESLAEALAAAEALAEAEGLAGDGGGPAPDAGALPHNGGGET
jgi:recombinational DNA repair protein (RecF pathway)